jgi:hypothetical protein
VGQECHIVLVMLHKSHPNDQKLELSSHFFKIPYGYFDVILTNLCKTIVSSKFLTPILLGSQLKSISLDFRHCFHQISCPSLHRGP